MSMDYMSMSAIDCLNSGFLCENTTGRIAPNFRRCYYYIRAYWLRLATISSRAWRHILSWRIFFSLRIAIMATSWLMRKDISCILTLDFVSISVRDLLDFWQGSTGRDYVWERSVQVDARDDHCHIRPRCKQTIRTLPSIRGVMCQGIPSLSTLCRGFDPLRLSDARLWSSLL